MKIFLILLVSLIITNRCYSDDIPPEAAKLQAAHYKKTAEILKGLDNQYYQELGKLKEKYASQKNYKAAAYVEEMQIRILDLVKSREKQNNLLSNRTISTAKSSNTSSNQDSLPTAPRTKKNNSDWVIWEREGSQWTLMDRLPEEKSYEARMKHPKHSTLLLNDKEVLNGRFELTAEIHPKVGSASTGLYFFNNGKWVHCTINIKQGSEHKLIIIRGENSLVFLLDGEPIEPINLRFFAGLNKPVYFGISGGPRKDNIIQSLNVKR